MYLLWHVIPCGSFKLVPVSLLCRLTYSCLWRVFSWWLTVSLICCLFIRFYCEHVTKVPLHGGGIWAKKRPCFAEDITTVGKMNSSMDGWPLKATQLQLVFSNLEQHKRVFQGTVTPAASFCMCVFPAEWDDPRAGRRGFLAGGPHPAGLQRRRTVLSGQPADALHRLPQGRKCRLCITAPVATATPALRAKGLKGQKQFV